MIELRNITVSYGDNVIYKDFSARFPQGLNVVVGASGSGKTTLLKVICGLVGYDGICSCDKVATVFQQPCLSPVSALNNVLAVLRGKDTRQTALDMLELCHIADKANKRATSLSGGEQQRVALARAFATERPILLLDEPFSSLDLGVKRKMYATVSELLNVFSKTAVLVTHDVDEALSLADRIYLLNGKPAKLQQIAEISTPRNARDEYSDEFVTLRKQLQQLLMQNCD